MLQIIGMILIVGFFAKMSNWPGMPLWVVYLFKSVTLLLFLYIIFILAASFVGVQIAAIVARIAGGVSIWLLIISYKKFVQKKANAQKLIDALGKE